MEQAKNSTARFGYLAIAFMFGLLILSMTVPSKKLVASVITKEIEVLIREGNVEDGILKIAFNSGLLGEFISSRIEEKNYLFFKLFEIHDVVINKLYESSTNDIRRIKFIGFAGQLIRPNYQDVAVEPIKHKYQNENTSLFEFKIRSETFDIGNNTKRVDPPKIYEWSTEEIGDASVDYYKDTVSLRIYRNGWAAAVLDLGKSESELTLSFDWEIAADGWAGTPVISIVKDHQFNLKNCDLALKKDCGDILVVANREMRLRHFDRTKGTYSALITGEKLVFFIVPSETSKNEGHANTYFRITNLQIL